MAARVSIRLLGTRQFAVGDEPWRFAAPPRTIPLLGYLVAAGRAASREVIAAALWPDVNEDEARANLRRHLHALTQALPSRDEPWVAADADGVRWNGLDADVDVIEFERAHEARDWNAAVERYGGDFLEGYYDEWIIAQRERMAAAFLSDLSDLLAQSRSVRDYATATRYAARILELDEWREDAVRALMAVRYEAGDRAGALGTYERFARKLAEEMRLDPMPETLALRDAIVRNAPVSLEAREYSAVGAPMHGTLPFVGRDGEVARLRKLWDGVAHRSGGLAFVSGEPGIGKTRLMREFALEAERQGGRVLIGVTSQPEVTPYEALAEALRCAVPYLAQAALDPLWLRVLAGVVPELQTLVPDGLALEPIGEMQERVRLFEAMTRALSALGRARPFLVVLEDLQWAGTATYDALEFIARRLAGISGVIVVTYRDDEPQASGLERVRRRLEREHRAIHMQPARLSRESVTRLLAEIPRFADSPPEFAASLHGTSEGNPLFLLHLLRDFAETGELQGKQGAGSGVAATITARVGRLPESARLLAEHAAVAGRTFSIDVLRDTTGWSEDDVLAGFSELIDRHLIRASTERSRYEYAFSHDLVQRGIYAEIPPSVRQRLHRRMAEICERMEAEHPAIAGETALHWDRAGAALSAARAYIRAADRAFAVYDNETVRRHARRALEVAPDEAERYGALRQLVAADERVGDKEAWAADVAELLRASEAAAAPQRFDALACAVRRLDSVGERREQRLLIGDMKQIARESNCPRQMATALVAEGAMLVRSGECSAAVESLRGALHSAREAGDRGLELASQLGLAKALSNAGQIEAARAEITQTKSFLFGAASHEVLSLLRAKADIAMAREDSGELEQVANEQMELAYRIGDLQSEAEAHRLLGYAACYAELDLERMREHFSAAAPMFERAGAALAHASVLLDIASIEVELGRYAEAEELLERVISISERIEWHTGIAIGTLNRAEARRCRGEYREAQELAAQALVAAERTDEGKVHSMVLVFLGFLECTLGESAHGLAHLREGIAFRRSMDAGWSLAADLCMLIESLLQMGNLEDARQAAEELEQIYHAEPKRQMSPANICWTLARERRARGDEAGYRAFVLRARDALDERCAHIKDGATREAFRNRPFCRNLLAAAGELAPLRARS